MLTGVTDVSHQYRHFTLYILSFVSILILDLLCESKTCTSAKRFVIFVALGFMMVCRIFSFVQNVSGANNEYLAIFTNEIVCGKQMVNLHLKTILETPKPSR